MTSVDPSSARRVIVIGAGFAGLSAADELLRAGIEPVVLEARDRVGGRVFSGVIDAGESGAVIEMGAEFILPGCTEMLGLVERFGLSLWDKGMRYGRREPRGVDVTGGALAEASMLIDEALREGREGTARELLDDLPLDPGAREAILARAEVSAAAPAELVPAVELGVLARLSDDPAPSVAGGNQLIALAFAALLGERVHLGEPVRRISWSDGASESGPRVVAALEVGEVEADACIVAVPATMIGRAQGFDAIAFDPPLPADVADAIASIEYGHASKLFVPLRPPAAHEPSEPNAPGGPTPPSATLSVPDRYWAWTATGPDPAAVQPIVNAFAGSAPALERLGIARGNDGARGWAERLAALRPDLDLDLGGAVLSTWDDERWTGAAYSLEAPATSRELIAAGAGPIVFAGEHVAEDMGALMEGAIRSGRAAAARIIRGHRALGIG